MPSIVARTLAVLRAPRIRSVPFACSFVILTNVVITWTIQLPTIHKPILEYFGFRQTQTAWQAQTLFTGEGSLLHPKLPVFGYPWEVPFEMPIFQLSASWLMRLFDLPSDAASRLASLIWFSLCLFPLGWICRRFLGLREAAICVTVFSFSPIALIVNRAALIEYCAVFFALFFVVFVIRFVDSDGLHNLAIAAVVGSLAGLVKSTTFIAALIFVAVLCGSHLLQRHSAIKGPIRSLSLLAIPILISLVATLWWTRHADAIKNASDATRWLTSRNLTSWNFGTLQQRLYRPNYNVLLDNFDTMFGALSLGFLLLSLPLLFDSGRRSQLLMSSVIATGATVFLFFNLYVEHTYYFVAVSPYAALAVTGIISSIVHDLSVKRPVFGALVVGVLVLALLSTSLLKASDSLQYMRSGADNYNTELQDLVSPDTYVLVADSDWNPEYLYGNQRRGVMLNNPGMNMEFLRGMPDLERYGFIVGPEYNLELFTLKRYASPVRTDVFRISNQLTDLPSNSFALDSKRQRNSLALSTLILTCDGSDVLSPTQLAPNTRVVVPESSTQQLSFTNAASLIPTGVVLVPTKAANSSEPVGVSCVGGGQLQMIVESNRP